MVRTYLPVGRLLHVQDPTAVMADCCRDLLSHLCFHSLCLVRPLPLHKSDLKLPVRVFLYSHPDRSLPLQHLLEFPQLVPVNRILALTHGRGLLTRRVEAEVRMVRTYQSLVLTRETVQFQVMYYTIC